MTFDPLHYHEHNCKLYPLYLLLTCVDKSESSITALLSCEALSINFDSDQPV